MFSKLSYNHAYNFRMKYFENVEWYLSDAHNVRDSRKFIVTVSQWEIFLKFGHFSQHLNFTWCSTVISCKDLKIVYLPTPKNIFSVPTFYRFFGIFFTQGRAILAISHCAPENNENDFPDSFFVVLGIGWTFRFSHNLYDLRCIVALAQV